MDTDGRGGTTPGPPCSLPNTRHPAKDPSPRLALQIPAQLPTAALQQGARGLTQRSPARGPAEVRCRPTGAGEAANFGPLPLRPVSKQHEVAVTPSFAEAKGCIPAGKSHPLPGPCLPPGPLPLPGPVPGAARPSASQGPSPFSALGSCDQRRRRGLYPRRPCE